MKLQRKQTLLILKSFYVPYFLEKNQNQQKIEMNSKGFPQGLYHHIECWKSKC